MLWDVLAVLGIFWVVGAAVAVWMIVNEWLCEPTQEVGEDPYRASLDAAARMSALGFEAERLMQAAAEQARREEGIS